MPVIHPQVSISPTFIDLKQITAGTEKVIPINLNVSFPTEVSLSHNGEDSINVNLYLEESHTVAYIPGQGLPPGEQLIGTNQGQDGKKIYWVWNTTVTNEGPSALVQPAKNDYKYPLGPDMNKSQTQIGIDLTVPGALGSFTRTVEVSWLNGSQRVEIVGNATGI